MRQFNKHAAITYRHDLYLACKGILRVKQAESSGMLKFAKPSPVEERAYSIALAAAEAELKDPNQRTPEDTAAIEGFNRIMTNPNLSGVFKKALSRRKKIINNRLGAGAVQINGNGNKGINTGDRGQVQQDMDVQGAINNANGDGSNAYNGNQSTLFNQGTMINSGNQGYNNTQSLQPGYGYGYGPGGMMVPIYGNNVSPNEDEGDDSETDQEEDESVNEVANTPTGGYPLKVFTLDDAHYAEYPDGSIVRISDAAYRKFKPYTEPPQPAGLITDQSKQEDYAQNQQANSQSTAQQTPTADPQNPQPGVYSQTTQQGNQQDIPGSGTISTYAGSQDSGSQDYTTQTDTLGHATTTQADTNAIKDNITADPNKDIINSDTRTNPKVLRNKSGIPDSAFNDMRKIDAERASKRRGMAKVLKSDFDDKWNGAGITTGIGTGIAGWLGGGAIGDSIAKKHGWSPDSWKGRLAHWGSRLLGAATLGTGGYYTGKYLDKKLRAEPRLQKAQDKVYRDMRKEVIPNTGKVAAASFNKRASHGSKLVKQLKCY